MPLQPNQLIGPYVLIRQLGRGTFGEVWLARHHDLGEERALKIPTDPQYVQQLRREGKVIYGLQHENIVRGFDVNTLNDPPYVAMEYVPGVTLRQKLKAGKLRASAALGILRQILSAVAYAHANGVLHRDLKPENVLINANGRVKVTDFGLGKVQAAVAQSVLMSGSLVSGDGRNIAGTIEYMSPQQKAGEEPDVRDDLYATGIIACELLTGQRPGPIGVVKMLERAGVDGRLAPFLEKALEPDRPDRYGSAAEMDQALIAMEHTARLEKDRLAREADDRARQAETARVAEAERIREEEAKRAETERARRAETDRHAQSRSVVPSRTSADASQVVYNYKPVSRVGLACLAVVLIVAAFNPVESPSERIHNQGDIERHEEPKEPIWFLIILGVLSAMGACPGANCLIVNRNGITFKTLWIERATYAWKDVKNIHLVKASSKAPGVGFDFVNQSDSRKPFAVTRIFTEADYWFCPSKYGVEAHELVLVLNEWYANMTKVGSGRA